MLFESVVDNLLLVGWVTNCSDLFPRVFAKKIPKFVGITGLHNRLSPNLAPKTGL